MAPGIFLASWLQIDSVLKENRVYSPFPGGYSLEVGIEFPIGGNK